MTLKAGLGSLLAEMNSRLRREYIADIAEQLLHTLPESALGLAKLAVVLVYKRRDAGVGAEYLHQAPRTRGEQISRWERPDALGFKQLDEGYENALAPGAIVCAVYPSAAEPAALLLAVEMFLECRFDVSADHLQDLDARVADLD